MLQEAAASSGLTLSAGNDCLVVGGDPDQDGAETATQLDSLFQPSVNSVCGPLGVKAIVKMEESESVTLSDNRALQAENEKLRKEKNKLNSQIMRQDAQSAFEMSKVWPS